MYMFLFKTKFESLMNELFVTQNDLLGQFGIGLLVYALTFACINFKKFMM